jgi:hypothetical protein
MSAVIDRIVEKNQKLWQLLTDSTLTREEKLSLVEDIFPGKPCEHDLQKPDHTMVLTHDLGTGHEYDSVARCAACGEQFVHPLHSQFQPTGEL